MVVDDVNTGFLWTTITWFSPLHTCVSFSNLPYNIQTMDLLYHSHIVCTCWIPRLWAAHARTTATQTPTQSEYVCLDTPRGTQVVMHGGSSYFSKGKKMVKKSRKFIQAMNANFGSRWKSKKDKNSEKILQDLLLVTKNARFKSLGFMNQEGNGPELVPTLQKKIG